MVTTNTMNPQFESQKAANKAMLDELRAILREQAVENTRLKETIESLESENTLMRERLMGSCYDL